MNMFGKAGGWFAPGDVCYRSTLADRHCSVCRHRVPYTVSVRVSPRDAVKRQKWSDSAGATLNKHSKVCDLHFKESDFYYSHTNQRKLLIKTALPKPLLPETKPGIAETTETLIEAASPKAAIKQEICSDSIDEAWRESNNDSRVEESQDLLGAATPEHLRPETKPSISEATPLIEAISPKDAVKQEKCSDSTGEACTDSNNVCYSNFEESQDLLGAARPERLRPETKPSIAEATPLIEDARADNPSLGSASGQYCCVCRCRVSNVHLRIAPKDAVKRRIWSDSTGVTLSERSRLCDLHFEENDFYSSKKSKRRLLIQTAVPKGLPPEEEPSSTDSTSCLVDASSQTSQEVVEAGLALENIRLQRVVSQLEKENKQLQDRMKQLEDMNESVEKFFTQSQLQQLRNGGKKVEWNHEDITYGISLHAAGPREYRHLLKKGFPLPCERTLQRWRKKLNDKPENNN